MMQWPTAWTTASSMRTAQQGLAPRRARFRPKSPVRRLKELGIQSMMLTGDARAVAKTVAQELGLSDYFAEVPGSEGAEGPGDSGQGPEGRHGRGRRQNLVWATGYNAIALPLAAGVAYSWGIVPERGRRPAFSYNGPPIRP